MIVRAGIPDCQLGSVASGYYLVLNLADYLSGSLMSVYGMLNYLRIIFGFSFFRTQCLLQELIILQFFSLVSTYIVGCSIKQL